MLDEVQAVLETALESEGTQPTMSQWSILFWEGMVRTVRMPRQ